MRSPVFRSGYALGYTLGIAVVATVLLVLVILIITARLAYPRKGPDSAAASSASKLAPPPLSPPIDMSLKAQTRASDACKAAVAGGRLKEHRRGNTGPVADRELVHAWGEMAVVENVSPRGYSVNSFVDTLTGYSGNIVRTPFNCRTNETAHVLGVEFQKIQFPSTR